MLLASKFTAVGRIFPAEVVYQVKGWSQEEFDILKSGEIEEIILNILDFDLVLLTPAEFIDFFVDGWKLHEPLAGCEKGGNLVKGQEIHKKLKATAQSLSRII